MNGEQQQQLREINAALLKSAVRQQELAERARNNEAAARDAARELASELRATQSLQQLSMQMFDAENTGMLYEKIMDTATAIMHSEFASLQTLDPDLDAKGHIQLRLLANRGFTPEASRAWALVSDDHPTTCGVALRDKRRSIADDVETCPFMKGTDDLLSYRQTGIRAVQSTPLMTRGGRILGMLSTHWKNPHDSTDHELHQFDILARQAADFMEHTRAEGILRKEEQRYRTLVSIITDLPWSTDANGDVVALQPKWEAYTGQHYEQYRGAGWLDAFHPDDRQRIKQAWQRARDETTFYKVDGRLWHAPSTSWRHFDIRAAPIQDADGIVREWVGTCTDIDDRKRADGEIRKARDTAEAANVTKDRFLAMLSHELRTPLTPVIMTIAALDLDPNHPPELREQIAMVHRNLELEVKLIDDLLDLNRIVAGKISLNIDIVDLCTSVRQACDTCRPLILERGIHLHLELPQCPLHMNADAGRLQQVFWNVLKNAAKFSFTGGDLFVRVGAVGPDRAEIRIRDTGIGIPPDTLPRIFDAFEQGDARVTHQFGGLGLGLAISKSLVDLHHGSIRAESGGQNQGSTFILEFPILPENVIPSRAPSHRSVSHANPIRILLVEDHPDTAKVLSKVLAASNHAVTVASSAAEALELVGRKTFDVIVSDIGLPDCTGYELMRKIKARYDIKGIAMSGYGMDEDIRKSREAGFSDHLIKPIGVMHLESVIRRLMDKELAD